jgi:hypothetical protein
MMKLAEKSFSKTNSFIGFPSPREKVGVVAAAISVQVQPLCLPLRKHTIRTIERTSVSMISSHFVLSVPRFA